MKVFVGNIKKRIPKINIQAMNFRISHRLFLYFLLGILIGTLFLNICIGGYATKIGVYSQYFVNRLNIYGVAVDKMDFFIYCIKKYVIEITVILLLSITPIGMLFNKVYCLYKGIVIALLISSATLTYGVGGILLYIISIFPHYIFYIPLLSLVLYVGVKLSEMIKEHKKGKFKMRVVIFLIFLAVGTAFFEAYVNYPILKIAFG